MTATLTPGQIARAIQDPGSVFDAPRDVLNQPSLDRETKKKILDSWEVDQTLLLTAEAENMPGPRQRGTAAEQLKAITKAKDDLSA